MTDRYVDPTAGYFRLLCEVPGATEHAIERLCDEADLVVEIADLVETLPKEDAR